METGGMEASGSAGKEEMEGVEREKCGEEGRDEGAKVVAAVPGDWAGEDFAKVGLVRLEGGGESGG